MKLSRFHNLVMSERDIEDVWNLVEKAKLDPGDLKSTTQNICFAPKMDTQNLRLLEMPKEFMQFIETGKSLTIRGEGSDSAVMCSEHKSWEIKEAELSNSMLVLPHLALPEKIESHQERNVIDTNVTGVFNKYYELRPWKPKIGQLKKLLSECPFKGKEFENYAEGKKYTYSDLLDVFQGSEAEFQEALQKVKATNINGFWRILEEEYELRVLGYVMGVIEENSWSINKVSKAETVSTLSDLEPQTVVEALFNWHFKKLDDSFNHDIYAVNVDSVCRAYALSLLKASGGFDKEAFLSWWQNSVPLNLPVSHSQLKGLVLEESSSIRLFSADDLPEDAKERFDVLFRTKGKWKFDEIEPYITGVTSERLNINALLTKYARSSTMNGIKMYSSKY